MSLEDTIWKLFPVGYLIAGTFYNYYQFTTIVVKKYKEDNLFIFFIALAGADVMVLILPLLYDWLTIALNTDIRNQVS